MSFIAKLKVEANEYNVLYCGYSFIQDTDSVGHPSSISRGGKIKLIVESSENTDIYDWMVSSTMIKSGFITFFRRDTMSRLKLLTFTDAYCVEYHEEFYHEGENPMRITIVISAKEISLNGSDFKNNWPE